jgi:hypothetical protein
MGLNHRPIVAIACIFAAFQLPEQSNAGCGGKTCAAGRTACSGYGRSTGVARAGNSFVTLARAAYLGQQAAAAQAAARREESLRKKAVADQSQLQLAEQAEKDGELAVAARIYQRLSLRRPRNMTHETAKSHLQRIQRHALQEVAEVEEQLVGLHASPSAALQPLNIDHDQVILLFDSLDKLNLEYAGVASVGNKIQDRIDSLRRNARYASILEEPAAAELWSASQALEAQDEVCCAVVVLEQAALLSPAPSANLAKRRLAILLADAKVVEASRECRNLQLCHEKFAAAQALTTTAPNKAREYFAEIIEISPPQTSVHLAARKQLSTLP